MIIVAALALIALVVIAAIFTGQTRKFSQNLESCASKQGQCKSKPCGTNEAWITNAKCPEEGDSDTTKIFCCISVFNT